MVRDMLKKAAKNNRALKEQRREESSQKYEDAAREFHRSGSARRRTMVLFDVENWPL